MKKIRLDLDQLAVESFATSLAGRAGMGTVRAHIDSNLDYTCWDCTSHSGFEWCICQPQANTNHQTCTC